MSQIFDHMYIYEHNKVNFNYSILLSEHEKGNNQQSIIYKIYCFLQNKYDKPGMHYVFNHVSITIEYKLSNQWDGARLLAAKVVPDR